jgi:hypothetical protein
MPTYKNKSFHNVLETLIAVCRDHPLVNSVESGDPWEINTSGNVVYPLCMIVPTSLQALDKELQYNFNVICMDLVEPGEGLQEKRVMSATASILLDIIAWFKNGGRFSATTGKSYEDTDEWYLYTNERQTNFTLEPFSEKFDDNVAGWNLVFSITMPHDYTSCKWDGWNVSISSIDPSTGAVVASTGYQGDNTTE